MTNLWEKEFLERFRIERSAQHPLRRAPNSCMRHRVETDSELSVKQRKRRISFAVLHINIGLSPVIEHSQSPHSSLCLTGPSGPDSWAETRRDISSAKIKGHNVSSWCSIERRVLMISRGFWLLTEASSPERTPGFLLRSKCRRELEYSSLEHRAWERETTPDGERNNSFTSAAGTSGCTVFSVRLHGSKF